MVLFYWTGEHQKGFRLYIHVLVLGKQGQSGLVAEILILFAPRINNLGTYGIIHSYLQSHSTCLTRSYPANFVPCENEKKGQAQPERRLHE